MKVYISLNEYVTCLTQHSLKTLHEEKAVICNVFLNRRARAIFFVILMSLLQYVFVKFPTIFNHVYGKIIYKMYF